jgi:MoxR-like ATPase
LSPTTARRPGARRWRSGVCPRRCPACAPRRRTFNPTPELVDAVNVALAVGAPLLLTGEPGTGKTQVAYYLAWYFAIEEHVFPLFVRSTTTAEDLLYRFDAVAYLHAANDPEQRGKPLERASFVERGPLWKAYDHQRHRRSS